MCVNFALLFARLYADYDISSALLYLCLFLYKYVSLYVLKCIYFYYHFYDMFYYIYNSVSL